MSRFLGPVHYWLYNKISIQEELTKQFAALANDKGWDVETAAYVAEAIPALETVIDESNIHGWLQSRIHDAEGRYAEMITGMLVDHPERIVDLEQVARQFGAQHKVEAGAMHGVGAFMPGAAGSMNTDAAPKELTAQEAYRHFDDVFVNGMPCDRVNVVTDQQDNKICWEQDIDIHADYWTAVKGDPRVYYRLRLQVMEGMLEGSGVHIDHPADGKYELTA